MKPDRPSATACLIASCVFALSCHPKLRRLVDPRAAEFSGWFVAAHSSPLARVLGRAWFRSLASWFERLTLPGFILHVGLRKRWLEAATREAIGRGVTQVVVLGAGYDTLALRLAADYPGVRFVEMDHQATQRVKLRALARRGVAAANVTFEAVDLTGSAPRGHARNMKTLFVAEGLLMYLGERDVDRLLQCVEPGGLIAFTFMERHGARIRFRNCAPWVDLWLNVRGEPFTWGLARGKLAAFLEARGLRLMKLARTENGAPVALGECLALAVR